MTTTTAMNPQTRDPLVRLPYETWLQCLSLAIHESADEPFRHKSADGPLPYLAVSPHWNETILSSPALWTRIIINNSEDEEARLHTFLHLSASQLLDVECPGNVPVQSLQLLAQHRTRIRSLYIDSRAIFLTVPAQLWGSLGHPKMRRLVFRSWILNDPIGHALMPACPNLQSLEKAGCIEEFMIAATLEEASVSIRTLADLGYLRKCTQLRSLSLMIEGFESMPELEVRNHFLQLLGPRLVNLNMRLSLEEFLVFMPYIPSFVALYSADFGVRMPEEEPPSRIATPGPKQGALNLRMLSLRLDYYGKSPTHRETVGHILDYLCEHQILQGLHTFRCSSGAFLDPGTFHVEAVRIASLLRCLSNIRVMDLIFGPYDTEIAFIYPPIHMPNLLELFLRPIALLAHIESPNLMRLGYEFHPIKDNSATLHLSEHFGSKISHLVVDKALSRAISQACSDSVGPKFESLRTLRITEPSTVEWVVHLPSIRVIDFTRLDLSWQLNSFLLDLLRHPEVLPNLFAIKTRSYPCWELLFEVLRRQNTAQMRRIQELVLPNFPILVILSRLVNLLQGHTNVYTNQDMDEVIHKRGMDKRLYV
jgi:hypothetical protein